MAYDIFHCPSGVNDGNRMRVRKSSGTLYWRATEGSVLAETDSSGATLNEYVFFAGRRIARRDADRKPCVRGLE